MLQTLFSQHFTTQSQEIHIKKETTDGKEKIQTPHDPQARYSTKRGKSWTGYKVHITETANEKGEVNFVTDIVTTNACERDSETLPQIQENLEERGRKPEQQFVDKGYVTGDNMAFSEEKHIQLMGEASQLGNDGLYTPDVLSVSHNFRNGLRNGQKDDFTIDYQTKTATCPAGNTSCSFKEFESGKHKGEVQINFGQQCQGCQLREKCTQERDGRKLRLHRHYQLLKERRQESKGDTFKQAMKRRPPVEGTISELVRAHGLRRSRYRGLLKTHLQNLMKGVALNLKRLVKCLSLPENGQKQQLTAV